jgi:hypothetical protein
VARRRAQWAARQRLVDPARLVFIDETWTKTNMAPLRGWAPRGERLPAKVPHGHWRTMTFLAALRHDRVEAPWLLDGPINGETFRLYVDKVLVPTLRQGDIVVMDNLGEDRAAGEARPARKELSEEALPRSDRQIGSADQDDRPGEVGGPMGGRPAGGDSTEAAGRGSRWPRVRRSRPTVRRSPGRPRGQRACGGIGCAGCWATMMSSGGPRSSNTTMMRSRRRLADSTLTE